jgi:hypothetical protein
MHRALATLDVLALIVAYCAESKGTLAALASTCQVISNCALDELWHTIDNIVVLARCMPQRFWKDVTTPQRRRGCMITPARITLVRPSARPRL